MRQQATPLIVYATGKTQAALSWIDIVLKPFCRIEWRTTAGDFQSLGNSIAYRAIELGTSIAFQLRDETSGVMQAAADPRRSAYAIGCGGVGYTFAARGG